MNPYLLTMVAAGLNVVTVYCIKVAAYQCSVGKNPLGSYFGIAITILAVQFFLFRAEAENQPLGLVVATIVTLVMIAAALFEVDRQTGSFSFVKPWELPTLRLVGYLFAIFGVFLVGFSEH